MSILAEFRERFVCPIHQSKLNFDRTVDLSNGVPLHDSKISCPKGCAFVIEKGIPRFVLPNNYSSSFGVQWQKYQRTQLDSLLVLTFQEGDWKKV